MGGYTVKSIDSMQSIHHGLVKLAGAELGVESFGVQVFDFPAGFSDYPEHDHSEDGQEELYVVLRGTAEYEVDGERVTVDPGRMLLVSAGCNRRLLPLAEDVRILVIGCTPGSVYERPEDVQLTVSS